MRDDTRRQVLGSVDGPWRALSHEDVKLLEWGFRARARWEQASALLLQCYGLRVARVTIAATRGEEDFDDERCGYGGLQEWSAGRDWRAYEDQPFRATDAAGNLLDVDLTLPSWRIEAQRADTIAAQAGGRVWRARTLALQAEQSAVRDWTALDRSDRAFFAWRELICDVLRAARVTLPAEAMAFDFTTPPPTLEGAIALRVDVLDALAAAYGWQSAKHTVREIRLRRSEGEGEED
jgi:hypothetical protein